MLLEPPDRHPPIYRRAPVAGPPSPIKTCASRLPHCLPKQKSRRLAAPVDPALEPARNHRRTPSAYHDPSSSSSNERRQSDRDHSSFTHGGEPCDVLCQPASLVVGTGKSN